MRKHLKKVISILLIAGILSQQGFCIPVQATETDTSAALEFEITVFIDAEQKSELDEPLEEEIIIEEEEEEIIEEEIDILSLAYEFDPENCLTEYGGVYWYEGHQEKYYNLRMDRCVGIMRDLGYDEVNYPVWTREDGCKMLSIYVMIAADTNDFPKGTVVMTSRGWGIVVDHCEGSTWVDHVLFDLAVEW